MSTPYEVWSKETETWNVAELTAEQTAALTHIHSKEVNNVRVDILQDSDGKWYRRVATK